MAIMPCSITDGLQADDLDLVDDFSEIEILLNGDEDYEAVCEWLDPDWKKRPGYDCYDYFDACKADCTDDLRRGIVTLYKAKELPSQQATTRDMLSETLADIGSGFAPGERQAVMAISRIPIEMDFEVSAIKRELAK